MSDMPNGAGRDSAAPARGALRFDTGRLLAGRYELLERIGEGGTAEVFGARDHRLERPVAVKVLRPQYGQDADARARFAVEARSAAALAVPNIVPVYDFGAADDGSLFIVMRFIDGPSLRSVLAERGSLPPAESCEIGRQVAEALAAAHAQDLVHRDVKPGNILLDRHGIAHLADFGTVKALTGDSGLTRTGVTFGTAAYLAPEQATVGSVGPWTDVYALGVVLYEALSGQPPFRGDDPMGVLYRHVHELPRPLASLAPGLDEELEAVVMACLAKEPTRRPRSARWLADRLHEIHSRMGKQTPTTHAALGGMAAEVGAFGVTAGRPRQADMETTRIEPVTADAPADAPTALWGPIAPAAAAATPRSAPTTAASAQPWPERGVAPPSRRSQRLSTGQPAGGMAVALLALALLVVAGVASGILLPTRDDGRFGGAATTLSPAPISTAAAVLPTMRPPATAMPPPPPNPERSLEVTPAPTPPSTPAPTARPTPEQTATPEPEPTPERTPTPEPEPTPDPTPELSPRPPAQELSVRVPNRLFVGDYDGPGSGRYHGRSASWVYGQGTAYHTMTASFRLERDGGSFGRRASLEIVGLDGENERKNRIAVVLNDELIYEGPNPLPNDFCCGPSGPGNWDSVTFPISGDLLRRNNTLSITNLEAGECTHCPNFVMVDYVQLDYRVRFGG